MKPFAVPAQMVRVIGRNTAYHLTFIPADRLDWKPAPAAKSALEIINHAAYYLQGMAAALGGGWVEPEFAPAQDLDAARELIMASADRYALALEAVEEGDLRKPVETPFGRYPMLRAACACTVDLMHHHGQLAYLQTMLGDTDDHFDPDVFGRI